MLMDEIVKILCLSLNFSTFVNFEITSYKVKKAASKHIIHEYMSYEATQKIWATKTFKILKQELSWKKCISPRQIIK